MKVTIEEINLLVENIEKNASRCETQPIPEGADITKVSGVVRTAITKHPAPEFGNYSSSDDHHPGRGKNDQDLPGAEANRIVVKLTPESANAYKSTFMKNTKKQMEGQSAQALNKISSREDEDDVVEPEEEEEEEE